MDGELKGFVEVYTKTNHTGYEGYKRLRSRYLYVMESKDYIKVGISFDPLYRCGQLNFEIKDKEFFFSVIKYIDCFDGLAAKTLEKQLHLEFKDKQIITKITGAKTECFCKSVKDDIISRLEDIGYYVNYDPFLSCHPKHYRAFLELNNITEDYLCTLVGKPATKRSKQTVQLSICNILANIQASGEKFVSYSRNDVSALSSGGTVCLRLLDKLFKNKGVIDKNSFKFPENIDIRYDVRVACRLKTKYFKFTVSPLYLLGLYSYLNNVSDYLTRVIDTQSSLTIYREKHYGTCIRGCSWW